MKKIIFVNDTAATSGGALTILRQFLEEINKYSNKSFIYYVFCSIESLKQYENANIKIITDIKAKKWLDRLKWDFWGLKEWSKKNNIYADLIISFQNTAPFYYRGVKIIIYFHQVLPFFKDIKWSLFNTDTRILWFYQNIYPLLIKLNLKNVNFVIVQTEWVKKAVMELFKLQDNQVMVLNPSFTPIDINNISRIDFNDDKFHIFYPAATYFYKNHELIIKSLSYIKDTNPDIFQNLVIHFTFSPEGTRNQQLIKLSKSLGVNDAIKLEGNLNYQKVLEFYNSVDLVVFPSYIETVALPLLEAALFGLPILVSDLSFSREIIQNYSGAQFLDYKNERLWAAKIIEYYQKKPRFSSFQPSFKTSWQDFFKLISEVLKTN